MWVEKHRPKTFEDYIISPIIKKTISCWIKDLKAKKTTSTPCLLLHGPPGTGKTTVANLLLKSYGFDVLEYNASDIRTPKLIKEKIADSVGKKNILSVMCHKKQEIGIIMDEVDGMGQGLSELMKLIFPNKKASKRDHFTPFICICNSLDKKLSELKKKSTYVKFTIASIQNLNKIARTILTKENIIIDDLTVIDYIVKKSQNDYRRLIILLEYVYTQKDTSKENVINLLENYDKKNIDSTYFEASLDILNSYDINICSKKYEISKSLVPLIVYENFPRYINQNTTNTHEEKKRNMFRIYKQFSDADLFDTKVLIEQYHELDDYIGILKCGIPSYIINSMDKKSYNQYNNLNYSTMLNKMSLEFNNVKTDNSLKTKLFNISNTNCMWDFAKLFFNLYKKGKIDRLKSLVDTYNLTKEDIDKLPRYMNTKDAEIFNINERKKLKNSIYI